MKFLKFLFIFFVFSTTVLFANVKDLSVNAKAIVLRNISQTQTQVQLDTTTYNYSFYNPALATFAKDNYTFSSSYVNMDYEEDIMQVLVGAPVYHGNVEVNYSNFASVGVETWSEDNIFLGMDDYSQNLFSILYAQKIERKLNVDLGARVNIEKASLGSEKIYSTNSLDLGINKTIKNNFGVGISILNLGDAEHLKFGFGLSKAFYSVDWYLSVFEPQDSKNEKREIVVSGDKNIFNNFNVFFGLDNNMFDPEMDFLSGLKFGFGLKFDKIWVDYAFLKRGELGSINYLTLNLILNKKDLNEKQVEKKQEAKKDRTKKGNYKIFVADNPDPSFYKIKEYIIQYLEYEKNLNIVLYPEPSFDVFNTLDIYASTESLPTHIFVRYDIKAEKKNLYLEVEFFDIYTKKSMQKLRMEFYSNRNLELVVRNLIVAFLAENKKEFKKGVKKKENERIKKILEDQEKRKLLERKRIAKFKKMRKFEQRRQRRILNKKASILSMFGEANVGKRS